MKKLLYKNAVFLQFSEGSTVSREICFRSTTKALEFYFCNTLGFPKGIDYEKKHEQSLTAAGSSPLHSGEWLDVHVTIGFYINRLGLIQRLILASFYGNTASNDLKIAQALNHSWNTRNYSEQSVKELRIKGLRVLAKHFRRTGIVKDE